MEAAGQDVMLPSASPAPGATTSTPSKQVFLEGRLAFPGSRPSLTGADSDDEAPPDVEAQMEKAKHLVDQHKKMLTEMNRGSAKLPCINVCIMVVGTHGDVAPFCALGKRLKDNGHRVRLATHANYRKLVVQESGLEFYPLAGDPGELSEFMVKTGGKLIPDSWEAIENLPSKLEMMRDIIFSSFPAATMPDPSGNGEGVPGEPFVADAIISNPPVYGHHHVAEALQIPLHLMFPQPWVPTCAFPHPLACIDTKRKLFSYKREWSKKNKHSYYLVQRLEWAGMGSLLNTFRFAIGLKPVDAMGMDTLYASTFSRVPFVHMWSPYFVPKPPDWGPLVDVVGNFFSTKLEDAVWDPPADLKAWLDEGDKPILVTFGSMKFDNAETLTRKVYKAAAKTGARVLLQSGWSELGIKGVDPRATGCFIMGRAPHDWLMQQCSAVVHHGGAGTTAAGLRCGLPTLICPFFGDQHFWGEMVRRAGLGPPPRPIWELTNKGATQILVDSFKVLRDPKVIANAKAVAEAFATEDGALAGMEAFKRHLPVENMSCLMCLRLCAAKIREQPRKAEIALNLVEDVGEFILCRSCYSVIKRDCDIMTPEASAHPVKFQKWGENGPLPPDMKHLFFADIFNTDAALARRDEGEQQQTGVSASNEDTSDMSWWDKKFDELSNEILQTADSIISKQVLLPGDEQYLEKAGYGQVLGEIRDARDAYCKERTRLENWIKEPGEVDISQMEREMIKSVTAEVYQMTLMMGSDEAMKVGERLATESFERRAQQGPQLLGAFQCTEKCFSWECTGELRVYEDCLEFHGNEGQKYKTSNGTRLINIPFKKIREAFVNSSTKNTWDGTGVQIRLKYHRFGAWGWPLLSYNFTHLESVAAAKEMHKVIEGALVAYETKHLARDLEVSA